MRLPAGSLDQGLRLEWLVEVSVGCPNPKLGRDVNPELECWCLPLQIKVEKLLGKVADLLPLSHRGGDDPTSRVDVQMEP